MRDCDPVSYTAIVSLVLAYVVGDSDHSRGRVKICCDAALINARRKEFTLCKRIRFDKYRLRKVFSVCLSKI